MMEAILSVPNYSDGLRAHLDNCPARHLWPSSSVVIGSYYFHLREVMLAFPWVGSPPKAGKP